MAQNALPTEPFQERTHYGALLEPEGVVMHGAGQDPNGFAEYWAAMPAATQPVVYMYYTGVRGLQPGWETSLKRELERYDPLFVIPQIGLSMTSDGIPQAHYEDDVAAGVYDEQIDHLVAGLRNLTRPAYLRIGYEFNGLAWNGYLPESYKEAFRRITDAVRAADIEVATVWCAALDGVDNYFDYNPGDEYIDWYGIDLFSSTHFTDARAVAFADSADARQKPLMIGETTPRRVGVDDGNADWNVWFVPFFNYVHTQPAVRQTNYINWDWAFWAAQFGTNWGDWGDARIQTSPEILALYTARLQDNPYLHAESEFAFRQRLGYDDIEAPAAPTGLRAVETPRGPGLVWDAVSDPSGLARYAVYREGAPFTGTPDTEALVDRFTPGEATYTVRAVDRAGNESADSAPVVVNFENAELLLDSGFESASLSDDAWRFEVYDGAAVSDFSFDGATPIVGAASACVDARRSTSVDWHIQLRQFVELQSTLGYDVRFTARANAPFTLSVVFQEADEDYTIHARADVALEAGTETYSFTLEPGVDDREVAFTFFLGDIGTNTLCLDEIVVTPRASTADETGTVPEAPFRLSAPFPNPTTGSLDVAYRLAEPAEVRLDVVDLLGRTVVAGTPQTRAAGLHQDTLLLEALPPGVYLICLVTPQGQATRRVVRL
ncbi:MAG: T9SS type A sorting domain-containing protein [Bacteroidota bacterium]